MDFLKNITLAGILFLFGLSLNAQNYEAIQKAFKESMSLEKSGNYEAAIKKMKTVYSDNSYEINLRLGWLNYNQGNFNESQAHYSRALKLMPYSEEAKFGLVLPLSAIGKWADVINLYKSILKNSSANTVANYRLGLIYYSRKDYAKALNYFKKVVDLYPFDYDGLLMYAWANFQTGKTREAKILFNKVLMLSPDDKSAKEGLSLIK